MERYYSSFVYVSCMCEIKTSFEKHRFMRYAQHTYYTTFFLTTYKSMYQYIVKSAVKLFTISTSKHTIMSAKFTNNTL